MFVLSEAHFEVWTITGSAVEQVKPGASFLTKSTSAVAVFPAHSQPFKGVKTMDVSAFVGKATRDGAVWRRG